MTLAQIEKTREFLNNIDKISNFSDMERFSSEIIGFYDKEFTLSLKVKVFNTENSYIPIYLEKDKATIKSFLESQLANNDINVTVLGILNLIDEGNSAIGNTKKMNGFVSKVYYSYYGKIKFDKTTESVATAPADVLALNYVQADENMVSGLLNQLRQYIASLLYSRTEEKKHVEKEGAVIDFHPTISASANATNNIDICISIEQARQQVEAAGLSDSQHQAVMDKLSEIEEIAKSKENKGKRWTKAKDILKWVAEQGITVAGIILPLLAPMIG